ncbi:arabinose efflux permease [Clostridium aceticum]|uniref:Arabinose efflux permease n=1 Tax=Clostridium aceticum TaxID=84022 RepID=A0A0D8IBJ7_9CLOT|nr:MFS transporter [Clostridium aceticum]AKL96683.1 arabinose efflux permease [Clostridium aceticum]KJF27459.1 hypothetical protein TZ02_06580 [Clostridium aceticum]
MKNAMLKIAVLSISLLPLTVTSASVALGDISLAFPSADPNTIKLIVSLPALLVIPFTLLCGRLSSFISKRKLLFMGISLFLIGGVGPSFVNTLTLILVLRGVLGIGMGFILPLATGLIADFFDGEERAAMMGLQSAVVNTGAIVTSLAAGFLSTIDWHYVFLVYLIGAGVLVITFFKLPNPEQSQHVSTEKVPLGAPIHVIALATFVYSLLVFSFFTNTAMVITEEGLGNAASSGVAITLMTVGGLVAGIIFGKVAACLKGFVIPVSVVMTGIGFLIISYPQGLNLILIAALIIGTGFGTAMPALMIKIAEITQKSTTTLAIAVVTSAMSLGQFVSPFVLSFIEGLFDISTGRFSFIIAGIGILAGGVVLCLLTLRKERAMTNVGESN